MPETGIKMTWFAMILTGFLSFISSFFSPLHKQLAQPFRDVKTGDSAVNHFTSSDIDPDSFSHNDVTVHY